MLYKKIFLLLALCLFALSGCAHEVSFIEIHPLEEFDPVDRIKIFDGSTDAEVNNQDKKMLQSITGLLSQLQLRKLSLDPHSGYQYCIRFYMNNTEILNVVTYGHGGSISISGDDYTVLNPEICEQFIALVTEQFS